ncbi:MAG: hypothetical protein SGI72_07810 [Planctomycetota bacterium]|nr:hypothetical protein [Planctomycetota bacterium]
MATYTITIDDRVLELARERAAEEGTSLDAILEKYITTYSRPGISVATWQKFLELTKDWPAGSGPGGRTWKRKDLYNDP